MKPIIFRFTAFAVMLAFAMAASETRAGPQDRPLPDNVDPSKYYVFYMHGTSVEKNGPSSDNKYYDILEALEAKGLVVIGEVRSKVNIMGYAKKVARQVRRLINAGATPGNITVSGHSRGAHMTMRVAAVLKEPEVRFIPIAGCGYRAGHQSTENYTKFTINLAPKARGNFMNMWEEDDHIAGNCDAAMKRAPNVRHKNMMLSVGGGHKLFWKPQPSWIDPFVAFAKGE